MHHWFTKYWRALSALALFGFLALGASPPVLAGFRPTTSSHQSAILGIRVVNPDAYSRKRLSIPTGQSGALVVQVTEAGPADRAGIETDDLIVRIDDVPVHTSAELKLALSKKGVGDKVHLSVWHEGVVQKFFVRLGAAKDIKEATTETDLRPHLRGLFSVHGKITLDASIKHAAVIRLLVLPIETTCDDITYTVKTGNVTISKGTPRYDLTELDQHGLKLDELFLPAGHYSVAISSRHRCRYAGAVVVRYLSGFGGSMEASSELHVINLRKEIALKRAIIESGLHQFVDVGHLKVVFTERLGDALHASKALTKVCKVMKHGFGYYDGESDLRYLITDRYRVLLEYANGVLGKYYEQVKKIGAKLPPLSDSSPPSPFLDLNDACRRLPDVVTALQAVVPKVGVYVDFGMKDIDGTVEAESHIDSQVVITKINMLIRRLFGYEVANVTMRVRKGRCDLYVDDGEIAGGTCEESAEFGEPILYRDTPVAGTSGAKLATSKIDRKRVETVLRKIFGEKPHLDFQVDSKSLILTKISGARGLIIKARDYWELIYLSIVPSNDYVYGVIEALYAPGLGNSPPPDEAFTGNTENKFPSETTTLLRNVVDALVKGSATASR